MVMLSTRLTGSSTSMISVSSRSARSTGSCAPGRGEMALEELTTGVLAEQMGVLESVGHLRVGAVEERCAVGVGTVVGGRVHGGYQE